MNQASQVYTRYQQLLDQSKVMLNNARQGMWDELIASEIDYVNAVHALTQFMSDIKLSMHMQEQLKPTLQRILANESEIKRLLQIRMNELAKLVGQSSIQQSVLTVYGKQGGQILAPRDNQDLTS